MPYESYKDSNGVSWTVITTQNGFTMIASVLDSADPKYDPPAEDLMESMAQGGVQLGPVDIVHTDPPTAEQVRVIFTGLTKKIEAYAKAHRGAAILKVTARPVNWWLVGGLLAAAAALDWYSRPRRRRRR
jgi:hypothetical protein